MSDRNDLWRLEPHVCRVCFSRVASRAHGDDDRLYQCTNCGLEAHGNKASVICACGSKLRKGKSAGYVDAGLRCHANTSQSPEFPAQYVASYGGAQADA